MLLRYGHRGIGVDSTHNTTAYMFKLTIVIVYDNYGCAVPVAFYLSKEESEEDLTPLFEHLKNKSVYHTFGRYMSIAALDVDFPVAK